MYCLREGNGLWVDERGLRKPPGDKRESDEARGKDLMNQKGKQQGNMNKR